VLAWSLPTLISRKLDTLRPLSSSAEGRIEAVALDVARAADVESAVNAIVERHGRLD
jgi:NADP-dependent 3-hydroxy acid dehydrogenase YdfG